jgi:hypothetical protein
MVEIIQVRVKLRHFEKEAFKCLFEKTFFSLNPISFYLKLSACIPLACVDKAMQHHHSMDQQDLDK